MDPEENKQVDRLLDMKEAAAQLDYEPSGLYEIVKRTKAGKGGAQIQFFQIGTGPIKFKQEWIDEFVLANSIEPGQITPARRPKRQQRTVKGCPIRIDYQWGTSA
jgi:hypothetical protein